MAERDKKTILVVEDNPLNMKLTVDLLELNGFKILKTTDGERAIQISKEQTPDLILLDIQLPGVDGFELFRRIREDKRLNSVKVAALTALVMKEDEKKIMEMGFDAYIPKPIDTKAFIKKIKEMA